VVQQIRKHIDAIDETACQAKVRNKRLRRHTDFAGAAIR